MAVGLRFRPLALEKGPHRSGALAARQRPLALLAALAAAAFAAGFARTQEQEVEAGAQAAGLTAAQILDRAIEAQGVPPGREPGEDVPLSLRCKVNLQYKSAQGDVISLDVERKFLGSKEGPGRIWTRAVPTSNREAETILAFDGATPWFWSRKGGLRRLDEPGGEQDRQQIEEDLETTGLLARAFLLRNLPSQLADLRRLDDVTRDGLTAWVIEGSTRIERKGAKKAVVLRLYVEQKTAWLYGARVVIDGEEPLQICLWGHERADRVIVPGKIELYWNDEPAPRQTFYVVKLELAPALTPEEFSPPKS